MGSKCCSRPQTESPSFASLAEVSFSPHARSGLSATASVAPDAFEDAFLEDAGTSRRVPARAATGSQVIGHPPGCACKNCRSIEGDSSVIEAHPDSATKTGFDQLDSEQVGDVAAVVVGHPPGCACKNCRADSPIIGQEEARTTLVTSPGFEAAFDTPFSMDAVPPTDAPSLVIGHPPGCDCKSCAAGDVTPDLDAVGPEAVGLAKVDTAAVEIAAVDSVGEAVDARIQVSKDPEASEVAEHREIVPATPSEPMQPPSDCELRSSAALGVRGEDQETSREASVPEVERMSEFRRLQDAARLEADSRYVVSAIPETLSSERVLAPQASSLDPLTRSERNVETAQDRTVETKASPEVPGAQLESKSSGSTPNHPHDQDVSERSKGAPLDRSPLPLRDSPSSFPGTESVTSDNRPLARGLWSIMRAENAVAEATVTRDLSSVLRGTAITESRQGEGVVEVSPRRPALSASEVRAGERRSSTGAAGETRGRVNSTREMNARLQMREGESLRGIRDPNPSVRGGAGRNATGAEERLAPRVLRDSNTETRKANPRSLAEIAGLSRKAAPETAAFRIQRSSKRVASSEADQSLKQRAMTLADSKVSAKGGGAPESMRQRNLARRPKQLTEPVKISANERPGTVVQLRRSVRAERQLGQLAAGIREKLARNRDLPQVTSRPKDRMRSVPQGRQRDLQQRGRQTESILHARQRARGASPIDRQEIRRLRRDLVRWQEEVASLLTSLELAERLAVMEERLGTGSGRYPALSRLRRLRPRLSREDSSAGSAEDLVLSSRSARRRTAKSRTTEPRMGPRKSARVSSGPTSRKTTAPVQLNTKGPSDSLELDVVQSVADEDDFLPIAAEPSASERPIGAHR